MEYEQCPEDTIEVTEGMNGEGMVKET